ncbi:MAG: hypothetical protein GY893_13650 [bacterium]|nr:hypothetical protein [bacterium]
MKIRSLLLLALLAIIAGCSGGSDESVLAKVGDREITASYYEDRLSNLKQNELPTKDGEVLDTALLEGKLRFLEIIIDKELMALKAEQLGFGKIDRIESLNTAVTEFKAGEIMHQELVIDPSQNISQAEIDDYYSNLQHKRNFHFILCNFEDDALKAREEILAGGLWEDVADKYNDGSRGPRNDYSVTFEYGRAQDKFERALFSAEVGEVTMPVSTVYGWWILRLNTIEDNRVPELDEQFITKIKQTLVARKVNLGRDAFIQESRAKHGFHMDEAALWIVFQGLPEVDEPYLNPDTNKPNPRESLAPLDIDVEDLDKEFYRCQFDLSEEPEVWTVGDYKSLYDDLNVFQRPKRSKLLNGVKLDICQKLIDKMLLISESRERGYNEHPAVFAEVKKRTEEMMVNKLFEEVIVIDTIVSPEEVNAFWAENSDKFLDTETGEQMELDDARNSIGEHIRTLRKDVMLRGLLDEWSDEFGVKINEEALMKTASWAVLVPLENSPVAGPSVPPTH